MKDQPWRWPVEMASLSGPGYKDPRKKARVILGECLLCLAGDIQILTKYTKVLLYA